MSITDKIGSFPAKPGVYLMKDEKGKVIYVGKAKNLRSRVRSYFGKEGQNRCQIKFLVKKIKDIDYLVCNNEKEALLLENSLIKKHKPRYNFFLKDDKSYVSVKLSVKHPYPALVVTRKLKKDGSIYYGPFSSADACRETVDFVYQNFRLRTCSDSELNNRSRPCLEYQIKRCTAPCVGYVSQKEYAEQVDEVKLFMEGKNKELIEKIKTKMDNASANENYEEAARWRDLLENVKVTLEKQMVVKIGGGHQDLIYLYRKDEKGIIALMNIREGSLLDSSYYPVSSMKEDSEVMEDFLNQYYLKTPFIPDEILISTDSGDLAVLTDLLSERKGKKIVIRQPKKGEKKELLQLAKQNAKAQLDKRLKSKLQTEEILRLIQEHLGLSKIPHRIECFDVSNISGKKATASSVVFINGKPDKNEYRHYKIRSQEEPNDYAMMEEVLQRRFGKAVESRPSAIDCPDLIIVDGGKGQLNVAIKVLKEIGLGSIPVISIAKGRERGVRAKEEIYLPGRKNPLILKKGSQELMMLQRIRDESHRFAIKYHRKLRDDGANSISPTCNK